MIHWYNVKHLFFLEFFLLNNSIHTMQDLQQESESLFEAAPSYLSSGQQAAARAEWNANPKALPPMTLYLGCVAGLDFWSRERIMAEFSRIWCRLRMK